jgi:DNA-binding transcriptional ArsR family regulator
MDVKKFLKEATGQDIISKLEELAQNNTVAALEDLKMFLLIKDGDTYGKHIIPRIVCRALIQKGPIGVKLLGDIITEAPGSIYPSSIVESLWYASQGELPVHLMGIDIPPNSCLNKYPAKETSEEAKAIFYDIVLQSKTDENIFDPLINFLYQNNFVSQLGDQSRAENFRTIIFDIFSESSINISRHLIEELEKILVKELREEDYQKFLSNHPVLLDPLASIVISKQKLGIERTTDFVIRRLDNEYILVEIEKPQNHIFTERGDFSAEFSHAFGQVIDFQEWVDTHAEYARHLMPEISSPRGLLIIGRRKSMSTEDEAKLKRFCINSRSIDVLTYDDLVLRANNLYDNICSKTEIKS